MIDKTIIKNIPCFLVLHIDRMIFITNSAAMNHVTPLSDSEIGVLNCNKSVPMRGLMKSNQAESGKSIICRIIQYG